jgi:small subunit ribosomal protein S16
MSVKLRLTRVGAKKKPFYRVVVADSRSPRDGRVLENVGTYDPNPEPPAVKLNEERIKHWISKGAKPSETVAHLFKKAGLQLAT